MENTIKDIINKFGGRYFGREQEKQAQEYYKTLLNKFCDTAEIIPFKAALEGHFQALKIFVPIHIIVLFLIPSLPLIAMILGLVNSILFLGHFVTYRHWLDFLFAQKTSYNVVGNIEPTEKATSTIIFAGHMDSVKEFKWWYKLKQTGVVLTVIASFSLALLGVFSVFAYLFQGSLGITIFWYIFLVLAPSLWVLVDMHGKEVVHGANDNLTGLALSLELGKHFAVNRLKNTRIRVISFGAEEAGLRGAFAYARANKQQLIEENALLINVDTIKDEEYLTIASSEVNTLCFFDKEKIAQLKTAFDATNTPVKILPLSVGASDASAFCIEGLPALSLIGMTTETLDPTYHTRLDNVEHLNPKAMQTLKKVLVRYVEDLDQ